MHADLVTALQAHHARELENAHWYGAADLAARRAGWPKSQNHFEAMAKNAKKRHRHIAKLLSEDADVDVPYPAMKACAMRFEGVDGVVNAARGRHQQVLEGLEQAAETANQVGEHAIHHKLSQMITPERERAEKMLRIAREVPRAMGDGQAMRSIDKRLGSVR